MTRPTSAQLIETLEAELTNVKELRRFHTDKSYQDRIKTAHVGVEAAIDRLQRRMNGTFSPPCCGYEARPEVEPLKVGHPDLVAMAQRIQEYTDSTEFIEVKDWLRFAAEGANQAIQKLQELQRVTVPQKATAPVTVKVGA